MGKDGYNLHIELNEHDQVIGPEGTRFSSKLDVLVRNGIVAPLNYKDWRLVPNLYKDRMWAQIKDNTDAIDDMRRILTDIERLAYCPDKVEDQWRSLVHYWSSENAKEKSKRNKESRKKLTMPHSSGRKSHSQIIDEMTKNNGVKSTRIEVFKKPHMRE